jgi:outer membrane biosynthesis protein TonB
LVFRGAQRLLAAEQAAEGQYEEEAAVEPAPPAPADEPEVQEPEKQEEEIQEPEIQEEEAQDPPARSGELAGAPAEFAAETPVEAPAEISAELPTDGASVPPSSAPAAPDGTAAITTLPETGGAPVLALTAGALLVCSGLVAAGLARPAREAGGGTMHERAQG